MTIPNIDEIRRTHKQTVEEYHREGAQRLIEHISAAIEAAACHIGENGPSTSAIVRTASTETMIVTAMGEFTRAGYTCSVQHDHRDDRGYKIMGLSSITIYWGAEDAEA